MEKFLFLDVDGVLNSEAYYNNRSGEQSMLDLDQVAVHRLQRVVRETGCKLVLSSSWRLFHEYESELMFHGFPLNELPLVGKTPDLSLESDRALRGLEVQEWLRKSLGFSSYYKNTNTLKQHCESVGLFNYAIVDDDTDMLYDQRHNFVNTHGSVGLTSASADALVQLLNTPMWELPYYNESKQFT